MTGIFMSIPLLPFLISGALLGSATALRREWVAGMRMWWEAPSPTHRIRHRLWTMGILMTAPMLLWGSFALPGEWAQWARIVLAATAAVAMGLPARSGLLFRRSAEISERSWIIQRRGAVQDQIMRACEREAMERRLRRCQATLMMTRQGGRDLGSLFRILEKRLESMSGEAMEAATVVGAFATHLRHVFMESDRDDLPLIEACHHVERWGSVLRALGSNELTISGAPAPDSPLALRRIPAILMLGATERLGMASLENETAHPLHWNWSFTAHTARLEAQGGSPLVLSGEDRKDWDAAFMLRHGGIAHAGGVWSFELPLLPE